jgi:hypothetical protein
MGNLVMKKPVILLILLVLAFSANTFAQKKKPAKKPIAKQLTAKQFFMALPNDYVIGTAEEREGYLVFPSSILPDYLTFMLTDEEVPKTIAGTFKEPEGLVELRVFRGKLSNFIGLRYQTGDRTEENPTIDSVKITTVLLENNGENWKDVTDKLMPKISIDEAHQAVIVNADLKDTKKENVWIETQLSKEASSLSLVARVKGSDSVTVLNRYKWNGEKFVETAE